MRRPLRRLTIAALDAMARVGGRCPACHRPVRPGEETVTMHARSYHRRCVRYERRK